MQSRLLLPYFPTWSDLSSPSVHHKLVLGAICIVIAVLYWTRRRPYVERFDLNPASIDLYPKAPSLAMPVRRQIRHWIVNVPLTKFRAPLRHVIAPTQLPTRFIYPSDNLVPIRNQGACGACWAFAVTDMLADRLRIASNGAFHQNLSVQALLQCFQRTGCDGGSPEEACLWLAQTGARLPLEYRDPFRQMDGGNVVGQCPVPSNTDIRVGVEPDSVVTLVEYVPEHGFDPWIVAQNVANMKAALLTRGPFYCAMTVYEDLFSFSGREVYVPQPGSPLVGGHAIEIIGFSNAGADPRPGFQTAHWVCRNSWSDQWPTQSDTPGYFCVEMGKNICGIESRCGCAEPSLFVPTALTKTPPARELYQPTEPTRQRPQIRALTRSVF